MFYYFAHILRTIAGRDQQSIIGFYHHKVIHSDGGDKFSGRINVVSLGIKRERSLARNQVVFLRALLAGVMLVESRPGTQVIPSELRRDTEDVRILLTLGGSGLEHCIIDADVFTFRVQLGKTVGELARSVIGGNSLKHLRRFRKMFEQCFGKSASPPQEHAAVPEVVSRSKKTRGALRIGFFCKPPHAQRFLSIALSSFNVAIPRLWTCRTNP